MVTTVQVTTARSARAFQECLLASEAGRVEFTPKNSEQTDVTFKMPADKAYDLLVKVMGRAEAAHGRRGFPHQSMHHLRTRVWWQLSDAQRQSRMGQKNSQRATKGRASRS